MKLIIAGGRDYVFTPTDFQRLEDIHHKTPVTIEVCGCARGADTEGERWAKGKNIYVQRFPADWDAYGKRAGLIRNTAMATFADALAVFPGGRGTAHMVAEARRFGLTIFDFRSPDGQPNLF